MIIRNIHFVSNITAFFMGLIVGKFTSDFYLKKYNNTTISNNLKNIESNSYDSDSDYDCCS